VKLVAVSGETFRPGSRAEIADNETVRLNLGAVPNQRNSAPTLSGDGRVMKLLEDATPGAGLSVNQILGSTFNDANPATKRGIAIVTQDVTHGRWQYSLNGGTWNDMGGVSRTSALLLRGTDRVRFLPHSDFSGTAALRYHAWDQTAGAAGQLIDLGPRVGGATAFSEQSARLVCNVAEVNDAPAVTGRPRVPINTDHEAAAVTVSALLAGRASDAEGIGLGLAVVTAEGIGRWQFSADGQAWADLGPVSPRKSRLLRPTDRVRFVPAAGWTGTARLTYRAWDQSQGVAGGMADTTLPGGVSAFSLIRMMASFTVQRAA
jgi:hypothetical protein